MDYPPLYALVCNAGVQFIDKTHYTKDGFEATFGVNHLGHFLLANIFAWTNNAVRQNRVSQRRNP